MKIGFLIAYLNNKGGAQANCIYLARELAKKHEVTIFASYIEDIELKNIKIVKCSSLFKIKYYLVFNPSVICKVLKADLDILHVHSFGFVFNDLAAVFKKLFSKTKIVNTPHGPFMALSEYRWHEKIIKKFIETFEYSVNKLYDCVIEVNTEQYSWMTKKGVNKKRIRYLPNGIPKYFLNEINANNFVGKYNLKNKFVISYLGRVQKYKGMDQVLKILPNLLKIKKNIVFVIAGKDADDKRRLEKLAKRLKLENSVLFSEVTDREKEMLYQTTEIFVLPSEWEAFGITILEAMAKNTAVISTRTEGGLFLIKEKVNGCLFDYGDLEELEKKFKILFDDKLREKIKRNNLNKAREFTWEKIGKDLEKIYKEI